MIVGFKTYSTRYINYQNQQDKKESKFANV